jgi:predicted house-cleaning noncanonical NTP pyrophosphatase (MazG superfamily)
VSKKRYNKLVRDKIPDIIKEHGEEPQTHVASAEEYWRALLKTNYS